MVHVLLKHTRLILLWGFIGALVFLGISLLSPSYYSAESQVLLISRGYSGVDPYTQAKAAERIGENLTQVMQTTDFYDKVMESSGAFDKSRWKNLSERDRRKEWKKDVVSEVVYGTSLLNVTGFGRSQEEATAFTSALTETVISRGWEYVGGDVTIKLVSSPLVSRLPSRPNYFLNILLGFALGLVLSGWWVAKYKNSLFGKWI